jgi:hypothetical protein
MSHKTRRLRSQRDLARGSLYDERDRRYSEVSHEREKALKIKEEADKVALDLAREIQTYKDEKARTDLRAITDKFDAVMKPVLEYIASQQGSGRGMNALWGYLMGAIIIALAIYAAFRH